MHKIETKVCNMWTECFYNASHREFSKLMNRSVRA